MIFVSMISRKDAIKLIKSHDYRDGNGSVDVVFMKLHRHNKTGGELVHLTNACGCGLPPNCNPFMMIGIKDMDTGKPYAVHNHLLFQANKQEVYWV